VIAKPKQNMFYLVHSSCMHPIQFFSTVLSKQVQNNLNVN